MAKADANKGMHAVSKSLAAFGPGDARRYKAKMIR